MLWLFLIVVCICRVQRLRHGSDATMQPCGFTEPADASVEDVSLWLPSRVDHRTLNTDVATYLVKLVSDAFCSIVHEELHAMSWNKQDSTCILSAS